MADCSVLGDWEQYPLCLPQSVYEDADLETQRQRLESEAPRIFSGHGDLEFWKRDENNEVTTLTQSTFEPHLIEMTGDMMYFIHQPSSWSHLQISADTVKQLLTAHTVSPAFLHALYSFGAKVTGDDDPYFNLWFHQVHSSGQDNDASSEMCYLLRSYEKHGRKTLKEPWSLRQMAVYHKYYYRTHRSIWILIQPFQPCKDALWKAFSQARHSAHPVDLHVLLIGVVLLDWRWYLNDRRQLIDQFNEKATHSSLKPKIIDYNTDFDDCQRLQRVSDMLSLAQINLQSTLQVAHMVQRQYNDSELLRDSGIKQYDKRFDRITGYVEKIQGFIRTAAALEKKSERTSQLLSKLLDYRKADLLNAYTDTLTRMAAQGNTQSGQLGEIAKGMGADSRSMSILTFIAIFYLPANLIAAIFSSGLLRLPKGMDTAEPRILSVQTAMWVYVVSSLALTAITVIGAYLWVWYSSRSKALL